MPVLLHWCLKASHNAPGELQTFSNQDSFTGEAKVSSLCLNVCRNNLQLSQNKIIYHCQICSV